MGGCGGAGVSGGEGVGDIRDVRARMLKVMTWKVEGEAEHRGL